MKLVPGKLYKVTSSFDFVEESYYKTTSRSETIKKEKGDVVFFLEKRDNLECVFLEGVQRVVFNIGRLDDCPQDYLEETEL